MDLAVLKALDGRRVEVAQLTIETLVSPLHRDGEEGCRNDGEALEVARRRKEQKRVDVGARRLPSSSPLWPWLVRGRVEAAWTRRWSAILSCSAARAPSLSL